MYRRLAPAAGAIRVIWKSFEIGLRFWYLPSLPFESCDSAIESGGKVRIIEPSPTTIHSQSGKVCAASIA